MCKFCANCALCNVFIMLESMRCRPRLLLQSAKTDEVEREAQETSAEREMTERFTFTVNGKREFVPRDQFPLTCALLLITSTPKLVASR